MASNCPLTCQLCTPVPTTKTTLSPSQCYDTSPTCPYSAYLCNSTFYKSLMAEYCPLTCGLCIPIPTTIDPCSDKSWIPNTPPSCSAFAGLCNIQIFQAIMTQYCPKTCGFCSSTPPLGTTTAIPGGR
uniref:ShKT domain-containing protein n=1 Tax=Acrobeloides nanus TaxID=290746 RepID=A0A914DE13_9BILA